MVSELRKKFENVWMTLNFLVVIISILLKGTIGWWLLALSVVSGFIFLIYIKNEVNKLDKIWKEL